MKNLKNMAYGWLRSSESFFKTDMIYLAKGGFWLGLSQAVSMLTGIILATAFANLLPKESYGTYQYIIAISSITGLFTLSGMGSALMRFSATNTQGILRYAFKSHLAWSVGIFATSTIVAVYYYLQGNQVIGTAILIAGITQPFISGFNLYKPYLNGRQLFKESSLLEIFQRIIPFVFVIVALVTTDDLIIITGTYFLSQVIPLLWIYKRVSAKEPHQNSDPELINYSKHLSLITSISAAAGHLDKILIWHFLGAVPVAIYTLAQMPIIHMKSISQLMLSLIFPKLAKKSFTELKILLPAKMRQYFILIALGVIVYILLAPTLFKLVFPSYPEAVIYSQIMALSVLAAPRRIISQTFMVHAMKQEQYILSISTPLFKITLLFLLLPIFGIWGAVGAFLITNLYEAILNLRLFNKINPEQSQSI